MNSGDIDILILNLLTQGHGMSTYLTFFQHGFTVLEYKFCSFIKFIFNEKIDAIVFLISFLDF